MTNEDAPVALNKYVKFTERLLAELGSPLAQGAKVFDLGSGGGTLVSALREAGYESFGADLYSEGGPHESNNLLSKIKSLEDYVLPYEDETFDFAISQNVFEHVQDYDGTLSELSRILKPEAYSVHLFPPRYVPIEEHVFVPGATMFQSYSYLLFFAWFSNLNPKWHNTERAKLPWRECARRNHDLLKVAVNYLSGDEILDTSRKHFATAEFADRLFFKLWPGGISKLNPIIKTLPFLFNLHSACRMRVLLLRK